MKPNELLEKAKEARRSAYAPYSHFAVGAALLSSDGRVFLGANIENAAYSVTCCAERVALFRAVSEGVRDFAAIAIVGGKEGSDGTEPCYPCGVCRQALFEFAYEDLAVYTADGESTLGELLPHNFGKSNLK
jgi:homotetrameric cytidine deaminase